jgi:hypothetical protein
MPPRWTAGLDGNQQVVVACGVVSFGGLFGNVLNAHCQHENMLAERRRVCGLHTYIGPSERAS